MKFHSILIASALLFTPFVSGAAANTTANSTAFQFSEPFGMILIGAGLIGFAGLLRDKLKSNN